MRASHFSLPRYTLLLTGGLVLIYLLFPLPAGVFDRMQIESGSYWSLLSGHFVHSDGQHLGWNVLALMLLGTLIERHSVTLLWLSLLLGIVMVDIVIYWAVPGLTLYCGLSGVLNTLWIVALGIVWRDTGSWTAPFLGLAGVCKLVIEMNSRTAIFTDTTWPLLVESHLAGQIAGLLMLSILILQYSIIGKPLTGEIR